MIMDNPVQYRFMVLEDDEIFMELNQRVIHKSGRASELMCFNYAQLGLDEIGLRIREGRPVPDFLLLDLRMPIINGFEFLEKLKQLPQPPMENMKIHLLTSSLDENDIERAFSYPHVFGFLSKPLSLKKIEQVVSAKLPIRPAGI